MDVARPRSGPRSWRARVGLALSFSAPHPERWLRAACPYCGVPAAACVAGQGSGRTLLCVLNLLRSGAITPQRLKLLGSALGAPARPWL